MESLTTARIKQGLSFAAVARAMTVRGRPVSHQLICYWEKGTRLPFPEDLELLGEIIGLSPEQVGLLDREIAQRRRVARDKRRQKNRSFSRRIQQNETFNHWETS